MASGHSRVRRDGADASSAAFRHGGLRWLAASDDAITFVREAPSETVLVRAARPAVVLPRSAVGTALQPLLGSAAVRPDAGGSVRLPDGRPASHAWPVGS